MLCWYTLGFANHAKGLCIDGMRVPPEEDLDRIGPLIKSFYLGDALLDKWIN